MDRRLLVAPCVLLVWASVAAAQAAQGALSQTFAPDARSLGMGRAFTSIAEGPFAAYWNPAALGLGVPGHTIAAGSSPYVELVPAFDDDVFYTSGGVMWQSRRVGVGGNFNFVHYGEPSFSIEESFEYTSHLGAGLEVLRWPFTPSTSARESTGPEVRLGLGANWKRFYSEFATSSLLDPDSPPFVTATEYDMDVAALLVARSRTTPPGYAGIRFGIVVSNALDRDLSFDDGSSDPLGRSLRTGFTVEGALGPRALCGPLLEARGSVETVHFFGKIDHKPQIFYGGEVIAAGLLALRIGFSDRSDDFRESTAGLGLAWDQDNRWGFSLDAANIPAVDDFPGGVRTQYAASGWFRFATGTEIGEP